MNPIEAWFSCYKDDVTRVNRFWAGQGRYLVSLPVE